MQFAQPNFPRPPSSSFEANCFLGPHCTESRDLCILTSSQNADPKLQIQYTIVAQPSDAEIKRGSNRSRARRQHSTMGQLSLALALINVGQNKPKQAKSCSVVIFIVAAVGVVAATAATSLKTPATPATLFQFGALTSLIKNVVNLIFSKFI